MITLRPTGGLCNRMLAIDSALKLCNESMEDLKIHWVKNKYLNASFFELFEPIRVSTFGLDFYETTKQELLFSDRELFKPRQRIYNTLLKMYQRLSFDVVLHGYETKKLVSKKKDFLKIADSKNILISSWTNFMPGKIESTHFQPVKNIQLRLDAIQTQFSKSTIGIHIRRSDHSLAIAESPTHLFIEKMQMELQRDPRSTFFLASDAKEVKEELKKIFEEKIILAESDDGNRNSVSGMQMAVIDLYSLANTKKIYGSFQSTFSAVASELGNIPFEEIRL